MFFGIWMEKQKKTIEKPINQGKTSPRLAQDLPRIVFFGFSYVFLSILPRMYWFPSVLLVFLNKTNDFQENWKFSLVKPMISKKRQISAKTSPGFEPRPPLYLFFVLISICVCCKSLGRGPPGWVGWIRIPDGFYRVLQQCSRILIPRAPLAFRMTLLNSPPLGT